MNIYAEKAGKYYDMGYSPVPVNGKAPVVKDWSKWCRERPSESELERLVREYGACNIGIACGPASGGLVFVDNDADAQKYPLVDNILRRTLPHTPVERIGAKGYALAYRMKNDAHFPAVKNKDGGVLFELLRIGRQTVIPPSIHPDTHEPYIWVGDDLLEYAPDELPEITLDMLNECAEQVRSAYSGVNARVGVTGSYTSPDGFRSPHGSQERLKALANGMLHRGVTLDYAVNELLAQDKKIHDICYFSDPRKISDAKSDHSWLNAARFYISNVESAMNNGKVPKPGDTQDLPEDRRYSTKKYGFFFAEIDKDTGEVRYGKPDYNGYSEYFCDKYKPVTIPGGSDGNTWIYNGRFYEHLPFVKFGAGARRDTQQRANPRHVREFYQTMQFDSVGTFDETPAGFLNLSNKVLDLRKMKEVEHSPHFKFKYVIDHLSYDPTVECPEWEEFLTQVLEGDTELIEAIQLYTAYTLIGGRPWLHQSICFVGDGRNGKSVLVEVIKQLLGKANYSATPLSELESRFKRVTIDGKLANFDEEAKGMDSSLFKVIVAGGDISAEYKNQDAYVFASTARLWNVFNKMPVFKDETRSVLDRLLFIPFNRYFSEKERDPYLKDKLIEELPGILNWALCAVPHVLKMAAIKEPAKSKEMKETYRYESDSVYSFFREQYEFDETHKFNYRVDDVYSHYVDWCDNSGLNAVTKNSFTKRIKACILHRVREMKNPELDEKTYHVKGRHCMLYSKIKPTEFNDRARTFEIM